MLLVCVKWWSSSKRFGAVMLFMLTCAIRKRCWLRCPGSSGKDVRVGLKVRGELLSPEAGGQEGQLLWEGVVR